MSAGNEDGADRFNRVAKRAAPMLGLALLSYVASRFTSSDTSELLGGLALVFVILAMSSAAFSWFDRR